MSYLSLLLATLFTPVPEPYPLPEEPDEAIAQTEKETQSIQKRAADAVQKKRRCLIEKLKARQAELLKAGKIDEAGAIRDRITLMEGLWSGIITQKEITPATMKAASVNGKYRNLLRVLPVPKDRDVYTTYKDFGIDTCHTYAGFNDLPPAFWVYVHPYWFVWGERVRP